MAKRMKASLKQTILCAVKFWSVDHTGDVWTLAQGVRNVVRKQGFRSQDIYRAERELVKAGKLEVKGGVHKSMRLGQHAGLVRCSAVRLAPWTDDPYPGAALSGKRRRRRKKKKKR